MDMTKLFQKKDDNRGGRSGQGQRTELAKKGGQKPMKAKKSESAKKAVAKKPDEPQTPWWERFQQYLREVVYELRRVVWPSKKETIGSTSVVLVIVLICGVYLGIVDLILSRLIRVFVG